MRIHLALLVGCSILSLAWTQELPTPTPSPAPPMAGTIEGSVRKVELPITPPEGVPAAGWTVLLGRDCSLMAKAQANADGIYRFEDLAPGQYVVQLSLDQAEGQGWEFWGAGPYNDCRSEDIAVGVEAGEVAAGPEFTVWMLEAVRGSFGRVFDDLDEDGERDPEEPGISCSLRRMVGDVVWTVRSDMEGNFRDVFRTGPSDEEPLEVTSCPLYPDAPPGYRVTAPRPGPCGRNGCVTRTGAQLYRCQDFGLHLVDTNGARFRGSIWENAAPVAAASLVTATIGNTVCGEGYVWNDLWDGRSRYEVIVRSDEARGGCGTEGAEVRFSLDGREIATVGYWQKGKESLDLVIGPPFAEFEVKLEVPRGSPYGGEHLQAYVGDVLCGEARGRASMIAYTSFFTLVVLPDSLRPGCGREGDVIRFMVNGQPLPQTATWSPGQHSLKLTTAPVRPPDTGTGALTEGSDGAPLGAGFVLLGVAAGCGLACLGLRRRAGRER